MDEWQIRKGDLKKYPHFDAFLPPERIRDIVTDPNRVATNAFFPFMRYVESWQPFRKREPKPAKKERPIRYASRRDAYIFSYYRKLLADPYEKLLDSRGLANCVLAYRKIPNHDGSGGKCNIHFAYDAFQQIKEMGSCVAVALDISSYFECIDHQILKELWCSLFQFDELPKDHAAVFKAITNYSFVDQEEVYRVLGYKSYDPKLERWYFTRPWREMPMQLCSMDEFRFKICGKGGAYPNLISKNEQNFGIPQGAPISDLLANLYLLEFDSVMRNYAYDVGGVYFRYSDDILMILPGEGDVGLKAKEYASRLISKFGDKLKIKDKKASIVQYFKDNDQILCRRLFGLQGNNGLEYLGFRFDGRNAYLRDSTLSRFYRKIHRSTHAYAVSLLKRYSDKNLDYILSKADPNQIMKQYGRIENFDENPEYRDWTFWTYVKRADGVFGDLGKPIMKQVRPYKKRINFLAIKKIRELYAKRKSETDQIDELIFPEAVGF